MQDFTVSGTSDFQNFPGKYFPYRLMSPGRHGYKSVHDREDITCATNPTMETPRKFIIAKLSIRKLESSSVLIMRIRAYGLKNLRGVSTKLN